mmetsp:Transcript_37541/g.96010  ORF Transcript_37541/g.96010 Transcript_37541/m.96010 type:complete len:236 (-) Transcript_37541:1766-2473(-)
MTTIAARLPAIARPAATEARAATAAEAARTAMTTAPLGPAPLATSAAVRSHRVPERAGVMTRMMAAMIAMTMMIAPHALPRGRLAAVASRQRARTRPMSAVRRRRFRQAAQHWGHRRQQRMPQTNWNFSSRQPRWMSPATPVATQPLATCSLWLAMQRARQLQHLTTLESWGWNPEKRCSRLCRPQQLETRAACSLAAFRWPESARAKAPAEAQAMPALILAMRLGQPWQCQASC